MDLPVWQGLCEDLKDEGFTVIAVALDSAPGAADPWIERASPTYPALIDREHRTAELYNFINVPQAVWINEEGRIVRPTETAGTTESFRKLDLKTFTMPPEEVEKSRRTRQVYLDAIRDWVRNGESSRFVYNEDEASAKTPLPDEHIAEAHANFKLGQHLLAQGREAEGRTFLERAIELHPDSWAMWRQAAGKDATGAAGLPDFWQRVQDLGEKRYYAPVEMEGIPE